MGGPMRHRMAAAITASTGDSTISPMAAPTRSMARLSTALHPPMPAQAATYGVSLEGDVDHLLLVELLPCLHQCSSAHAGPLVGIVHQVLDRPGQREGVSHRHQQPRSAIVDHLAAPADVSG